MSGVSYLVDDAVLIHRSRAESWRQLRSWHMNRVRRDA